MKKIDKTGSKLCSYQAKIFKESVRLDCSSKIFIRRFFMSDFASKLDRYEKYIFTYDTKECFDSLKEQYNNTDYGSIKINEDILYYVGYLTRYISYTRNISSKYLYKNYSIDMIIDNYEIYHTQSEERVIKRIQKKVFNRPLSAKEILLRLW